MKKLILAACFCVTWAVTCFAQTALRPDQISPATPDITWAPGGTGYQIGSTIPWRSDPCTTSCAFLATDAVMTVELTAASAISPITLPDINTAGTGGAPPPFGTGFGFSIQTGAQSITLNRFGSGTQKINGLNQIKVGAYQLVALASRGGSWYATFSLPQPATQTGANVLADNMTWVPAGAPVTPVISGVSLPTTTFTAGTAGTVGTATATMSAGSFAGGTWDLQTTGTATAGGACTDYTGKFAIGSTTGVVTNTTTAVTGANAGVCLRATLTGATGSPFSQAATLTGSAAGSAPTGNCAESTTFFARVWALPATLDGTVGASIGAGTGHLGAYDALICNLNATHDNLLVKLDALWMPATNTASGTNTAVANLNLLAPSGCTTTCYTLVPTGGADTPNFVADRGYTGSAGSTTMYINTGFNPSTGSPHFALGEAHMSIWALNNANPGFGKAMGSANAALTGANIVNPRESTGNMICSVTNDASTAAPVVAPVTDSLGSTFCEASGGQTFGFRNGALLGSGTVAAATNLAGVNMYLLNWDWTTLNGGPWQIAQASVGASLSLAQISSTSTTGGAGRTATGLVPRVCQYLRDIGAVASC